MSNRKLKLTVEARADIQDIFRYTQRQWGRSQRLRFEQSLNRVLAELTDFPGIGRAREDLDASMRMRIVGQHVIYYLAGETSITVVRVRHVRQDTTLDDLERHAE